MVSIGASVGSRGLWRSRWAAFGAAVAVTLGGGGLFVANAAPSAPSSVVTIDPVRILDTRDPLNIGLPGPFVSAVSQKLQVTGGAVPAGATGVLLNATVVGPTAAGFLSVRPGDAVGAPSTSSLNFVAGDIVPNAVQVGLPTAGANAGQIDITYDAFGVAGPTTEVLIDVVGYMVAGGGGAGPAGPAGSAVAYAQIADTAPSLVLNRTRNITGVTRPATGTYCLSVDPAVASLVFSSGEPIRTMVATVEFGNTVPIVANARVEVRGSNAGCGANLLEIHTFDGGTAANGISFTVAVV